MEYGYEMTATTYEEYLALPAFAERRYTVIREGSLSLDLQRAWSLSLPYDLGDGRVVDGPGPRFLESPEWGLTEFQNPTIEEKDCTGPKANFDVWDVRAQERLRDQLENTWRIKNRRTAVKITKELLNSAGDPTYRVLRPLLQEIVDRPVEERRARAADLFDNMVHELSDRHPTVDAYGEVQRVVDPFLLPDAELALPSGLPSDTVGWDVYRAMEALFMACRARILSEEKAEPLVLEALEITRNTYRSWREHVDGFIVGRTVSLGTIDDSTFEEIGGLADALHHPDSLWANVQLTASG